jgi:hypothetical protein
MKSIEIKIFSHKSVGDIASLGSRSYSNKEVRESEPLEIGTYRDLVKDIAYISFYNPNFSLFFRGQSNEYADKYGATSLYPTIYRNENGMKILRKRIKERRFEKLAFCKDKLVKQFSYKGKLKLEYYDQLSWAILQHYRVCCTPLLDVTQSLRAACSFALNGKRLSNSS